MNRMRHLYLAIVGDEPTAPAHQHTMDCHPSTCDISHAQYSDMRRPSNDALMIEELRDALRPFARMHREGLDPTQIMCAVQSTFGATMITAADFDRAFYLLDEHNI